MQYKQEMSTKRKLQLLLIIWVILAFIIGLVSYVFYPSWLAAAPLLAIVAAAAALAILDQLGGALGFIDTLYPAADTSQDERVNDKNEPQPEVHTPDGQIGFIGDHAYIEGGIQFHTAQTLSEQTNRQASSIIFILREKIAETYNLDEIRLLCAPLNVDYDELAGDTKSLKIESLVTFMQRRGRMDKLITWLEQDRPHSNWPGISVVAKEIEDESLVEQSQATTHQVDTPLAVEDISIVGQQLHTLLETVHIFQKQLSPRPELVLAFEELSAEIRQITTLIDHYLQENPTHSLKRVLQSNIDTILNQCEIVRQELGQALLQANKDPFDDFTQGPGEALENLGKHLVKFTANLERGGLSSGRE